MIQRGPGYTTHISEREDRKLSLREAAALADLEIRCVRCSEIVGYERGTVDLYTQHFFCPDCRALGVQTEKEQNESSWW